MIKLLRDLVVEQSKDLADDASSINVSDERGTRAITEEEIQRLVNGGLIYNTKDVHAACNYSGPA